MGNQLLKYEQFLKHRMHVIAVQSFDIPIGKRFCHRLAKFVKVK